MVAASKANAQKELESREKSKAAIDDINKDLKQEKPKPVDPEKGKWKAEADHKKIWALSKKYIWII